MRISPLKASIAVLAAARGSALGIAACGGGRRRRRGQVGRHASRSSTPPAASTASTPATGTTRPTTRSSGSTTQRWLYGWKPDDNEPTPDIADGPAEGLERRQDAHDQDQGRHQVQPAAPEPDRQGGGHQVRDGALLPARRSGNGYAGAYYGDIEGVKRLPGRQGQGDLGHPGARRHDARASSSTQPVGRARERRARSALPCTVPVPKDYAQKYDKGKQSTYGEHQVFTGPYMIENDGKGKITGYQPGQAADARAQPELGQVDRLPAGVLRQDRLQRRQRRQRRRTQDRSRAEPC